jgi:DNA repair exonuclease SbcCD ATPase subunit
MKLFLSNFRCFKDFVFEIPEDNGVLLLWGTSGIGKTTIFKAINFVLYGKEQKVTKHGEKKCKVVFEFKDVIITRTKCPNHLTLKRFQGPLKNETIEFSDEPAQKEIEKIFGKDFLLTSYMAQKSTESFFSLSSNDKSAFLHRLSIKDFDVDSIRKKTRELIRQRKEKILINTTEQRVVKNMYDSLNCSSAKEPKIKIDLKGKSIDEFIESENKLKEKVKKFLKEKREELSLLLSLLEKIKINTVRIEEKNKQLNDIIFKLQDYSYLENGIALDNLKATLEEYNKITLYYTLKKSCKDLKNEYDKMVEDEKKKIEEDMAKLKLKKLGLNILKDGELEDLIKAKTIYEKIKMKTVSEIKSKLSTLNTDDNEKEVETARLKEMRERLPVLQVELENIKKNIKDIAEITSGITTKHKCPKCDTKVYIDKDCIKEIPENLDELKMNLESLKKKREKLDLEISSLSKDIKTTNDKVVSLTIEISNNIKLSEELSNYLKILENIPHTSLSGIKGIVEKDTENRYVLKTIEESLNNLEEKSKMTLEVLPHYIKKKRDELLSTKKKYEEVKEQLEDVEINENLNWYMDEIQNINSKISRYEQSIKERNKLIKDKETLEKEIEGLHVDDNKNVKNIDELQDEINKKMEMEEKLKQREVKLIKYKEDLSVYKKQLEIILQLDNLKQDENILLRGLKTAETLFKKINDAEAISLENTLDIINKDLEEFVTHFFGEHFSAKLQSFKESKDGDKKASIEILIVQDGETVPLDALSGGEYDRLALALFLCFNKISKSNIILLDECLASLHSELVEDIVELIKTKLNDKLVIFTLHQANTGIFDTIIDIEEEIRKLG